MILSELNKGIYYVGVNDRTSSLFESLWSLPAGVSYNSYIVKGDKTAFNTLYEKKFTDIAMTRYDESMKASKETDDFFKGLFENADKFKFFKELLLTEVYKELRNLD